MTPTATARRRSTTSADAVCAAAVDEALAAAAEEAAPGRVGEHLGVLAEEERVVTHRFRCEDPGYAGWVWAVTLARAPRSKQVTVDEVVLLPDDGAILAPAWVPWSERLQPGDLGVGDVLPTAADDPRLEQGYAPVGDEDEDRVALWELGLGRRRVVSREGRDDAVDRWYTGDHGPHAPIAVAAPASCATCGFLWLLSGSMRQAFGVCTNEISPSDGRVVSLEHGCGGHSEAAVLPSAAEAVGPVVDYDVLEVVDLTDDADSRPAEHTPGSVDDEAATGEDTAGAEDLGHS